MPERTSVRIRRAPRGTGIRAGDRVYVDQHGFPWSGEEWDRYQRRSEFERLMLGMQFAGPYVYRPRLFGARAAEVEP